MSFDTDGSEFYPTFPQLIHRLGNATEAPMASVHDVTAHILQRCGPITSMKMHKLLYFAQAWSMARNGTPLFPERIEAWRDGPAVPEVFRHHAGKKTLTEWPLGNASYVSQTGAAVIALVLSIYGHQTGDELRHLSHRESPWMEVRRGLLPYEKCSEEITLDLVANCYSTKKYIVAGEAYADGRLSLDHAVDALQMHRADVVALFEEMGFTRSLDMIRLDADERTRLLAAIRKDRMQRSGAAVTSLDLAKRSVVATQRIEGVDARPWIDL